MKERQMEFDTESDQETLYELFGEDADALAESVFPVFEPWSSYLTRFVSCQIEVPSASGFTFSNGIVWKFGLLLWETAIRRGTMPRRDAPNPLRALYGTSLEQNGLMGSSDTSVKRISALKLLYRLFCAFGPCQVAKRRN